MISLLPRDRGRTAGEQSGRRARGDEGSSGGTLRKLLFALGVVALAYFVARRFGSGDTLPGNGHEISIGESDDESGDESTAETDEQAEGDTESGVDEQSDTGDARDGDEAATADESGADETGDEMGAEPDEPPEAIEQRTEADADEEPMEPGEMTVDEDVVEELDDEPSADEGDEDDES